jgi:hypothetical protein
LTFVVGIISIIICIPRETQLEPQGAK